MAIIYTSFKKRKRNRLPQTESLIEARLSQRKYLKSLGIDPDRKINKNKFRVFPNWWETKPYQHTTKERTHVVETREATMGNGGTKPNRNWRLEESQKFTVAPAYNKGAYQVITKSNIKDIGR
tara:strand:- start:339 stop:707 length:369 start_codon:yes stop_codon:yes gene_type:complete